MISSSPVETRFDTELLGRRVLVTGASGFVGRHVVRELLAHGHRVTAVLRPGSRRLDNFGAVVWEVGDIGEIAECAGRLEGVDAVIHCAARVHVLRERSLDPLAAFRKVNVDGTLAVARAAAIANVRRFIHLSTIGVNGTQTPNLPFRAEDPPAPQSPYAQSKFEAEQALDKLAAGTAMEVVHVRPPMVYGFDAPGNFALLSKAVRSGVPLPLGGLHQLRSFVGIRNLCDLLRHIVEKQHVPTGPLLVSDNHDLSTTDFVRKMICAQGSSTLLLPVPEQLLRLLAGLVGRGDQVHKMSVRLVIDARSSMASLSWMPPHTVDQELHKALCSTSTL